MLFPNTRAFKVPHVTTIKGLESTGFRDIGSENIEILDEKTIRINNFHFEAFFLYTFVQRQ